VHRLIGRILSIEHRVHKLPERLNAGEYSAAGSSSCTACSTGTYQSLVGQVACLSCIVGMYARDTGSVICYLHEMVSPTLFPSSAASQTNPTSEIANHSHTLQRPSRKFANFELMSSTEIVKGNQVLSNPFRGSAIFSMTIATAMILVMILCIAISKFVLNERTSYLIISCVESDSPLQKLEPFK
jgi:hypothetical protein